MPNHGSLRSPNTQSPALIQAQKEAFAAWQQDMRQMRAQRSAWLDATGAVANTDLTATTTDTSSAGTKRLSIAA